MHEDLPVQYHQQDTDYYCGAACAQMVLEQCGAGLLDQDDLYNDNHSHSTTEPNWYTGPDGLTWTMNNRQSGRYFVLDALATEDAISRMVAWTIHNYQVAPIAMVYGWAHWITVRGYSASAAPNNSGDTSYTISSFDVNNPWPPTPLPAPPPPHSAGDPCGSGGARGVADEHLTYATWRDDYMTGIPAGFWAGRYVAVCDPDPPPDRLPREQEPHERPADGRSLLDPGFAVEQALVGLRQYGVLERGIWRSALDGTEPGEPVLVQRLDRVDSFYWIVPMSRRGEVVPSAVAVDARFGDYRQAIVLPEPQADAFALEDDTALLDRVVGQRFELPERQGRLPLRKEALHVYPTLVWRPCRESLSPFAPFKLIIVGAHQLYVRLLDGQVFVHLTTGKGI
jgi:hypothetical protein